MKSLKSVLKKFDSVKVSVFGDSIFDEYIIGDTNRISREAPVPIIEEKQRYYKLGGSANVAANIASLGGIPYFTTIIGKQKRNKDLDWMFKLKLTHSNIKTDYLVEDKDKSIDVKTRILTGISTAQRQQVARVDRIYKTGYSDKVYSKILKMLNATVFKTGNLLVSEYNDSINSYTRSVIQAINKLAELNVVVVDSRYNIDQYSGVYALTPNLEEMSRCLNKKLDTEFAYAEAVVQLHQKTGAENVLLKLGNKGVLLYASKTGMLHRFDAVGGNPVDTTGAGDVVAATFMLATISGCNAEQAAKIANTAGGLSTMYEGSVQIKRDQLLNFAEVCKEELC